MRIIVTVLLTAFATSSIAHEHGPKGHQNLKVLADLPHKQFDTSMKAFSKGLGVKCTACHVEGAYEKDDLPTKQAAREFMTAVIGESDQAKRGEALKKLLGALKIETVKDEAKVWQAVSGWKKKPAESATH
jgi:hypothetical protein